MGCNHTTLLSLRDIVRDEDKDKLKYCPICGNEIDIKGLNVKK